MTNTPLQLIHQQLLGQLKDITQVCHSHNIPYTLARGSLLGAVRHQGFIPWDDDMDILMTRENFKRFAQVYPDICDEKYYLTYTNTWTPRVMSKNPQIADLFTDIFILDYLPTSSFQRKVQRFGLRILQGMLKKNVDYSRFSLPQKVVLWGTYVLGLPFSVERKTRWYASVSQWAKDGTDCYISNGLYVELSDIWEPALFENTDSVLFEGIPVSIPEDAHTVLTRLYGDYMTPPPKDEQAPKHLDL